MSAIAASWMDNVSWLVERRAALLRAIAREDDEYRAPEPHTQKIARRNALDIIERRLVELRRPKP